MRKNISYLIIALAIVIGITGCKEDEEGTFVLEITAMADGNKFVLGQEYQDVLDHKYKLELLRMYISNLKLVKSDGSEVMVKDVSYVKFENHHSTTGGEGETIFGNVPEGSYTGMKFAVGVDEVNNHSDPATYEQGHPLSVFNNAHWNWFSGYIFAKMEGRVDTVVNGSGTFDNTFLYHVGTDTLYREVAFTNESINVPGGGEHVFDLKLDVQKLFYSDTDTINTPVENITHTSNNYALAEKVMNNISKAFYK